MVSKLGIIITVAATLLLAFVGVRSRNRVVSVIVIATIVALVGLLGYRLYEERSPWQEASEPQAVEETDQKQAAIHDPADEQDEAGPAEAEAPQAPASEPKEDTADTPSSTETADDPADIPSFDVVRVERTGEGVVAGRAEPGWSVALQSNGETIAETDADQSGQWSLVLDEPLGEGEHSLSIVASAPDGAKSLTSQQKVLVSMGDDAGETTLVALREPGKATQILQEHSADTGPDDGADQDPGREQELAAADTGAPSDAEEGSDADKARSEVPAGETASEAASREDAVSGKDEASDKREESTLDGATVEATEAGDETLRRPEPPIRIKTVDYEDRGDQSGQIIVTGTSTEPSTGILLYLDGELIGESKTDADGGWKIEATKHIAPGNRALQVDLVDRSKDVVLGRAAVGMRRQPPPEIAQEVAEAEPEARAGTAQSPEAGEAEPAPDGEAAGPGGDRIARADRVAGDRAGSGASDMSAPPEQQSLARADRVAGDRAESGASDMSAPPEEQSLAEADRAAGDRAEPGDADTPAPSNEQPVAEADRAARDRAEPGDADTPASPEEQSLAAAEDVPDPERAPGEEVPDPDRAPGEMARVEAQTQPERRDADVPKVYTVRRGDTLWAIAEEHFGRGWRYTMIFKDNRHQIRDPHWIYPDQEFKIRPR